MSKLLEGYTIADNSGAINCFFRSIPKVPSKHYRTVPMREVVEPRPGTQEPEKADCDRDGFVYFWAGEACEGLASCWVMVAAHLIVPDDQWLPAWAFPPPVKK